jgi:branched-chain amino acid transport system permease protein
LGAAIAGVAGGLNAHYTFTIGPGNYGFENAVDLLTMTVFGGISSLVGPVLGATVLGLLPEIFHELKEFLLAFNGFILVVVILYLPNGIWDMRRLRAFWQRRQLAGAR